MTLIDLVVDVPKPSKRRRTLFFFSLFILSMSLTQVDWTCTQEITSRLPISLSPTLLPLSVALGKGKKLVISFFLVLNITNNPVVILVTHSCVHSHYLYFSG